MKLEEAQAIVDALVKLRESATDEQAINVPVLYTKWREGQDLKTGERLLYDNILYKVLTDHVSQSDWTPDAAPSLFAKVLIPDPDIIPEWEQPDSTNAFMTGDKVKYNDFVWVSLIDNNIWEPSDDVPTLWSKQ